VDEWLILLEGFAADVLTMEDIKNGIFNGEEFEEIVVVVDMMSGGLNLSGDANGDDALEVVVVDVVVDIDVDGDGSVNAALRYPERIGLEFGCRFRCLQMSYTWRGLQDTCASYPATLCLCANEKCSCNRAVMEFSLTERSYSVSCR
jgi:hypothetical protein